MKKTFSLVALFALLVFGCVNVQAQAPPPTAQEKAVSAKLLQLLEESGYNYTKASGTVWSIAFKGKQLAEFNVIVIGHEGLIVLVAVVAEKADFNLSPEMMRKLLQLNDNFDRVKVGIDDDGDLFTRIDLTLRIVDVAEFKTNLEQISAAAAEAYAAVKPFLLPKKAGK